MRLEEIINAHRQDLNQTDMMIWKYIFNHRSETRHVSIHSLARACSVSSTTIVRFAKKLGFDGFGELKAVLKLEEPEKTAYKANVLKDLGVFYEKTWSQLMRRSYEDASRLVYEADRIFAFASGYVQSNVVQELKRMFFYGDVLIYEIKGREEFYSILRTLTPDDVFIFVSFSSESPAVVDFARQLQLKDVPLISITQLHDNTLASLSTANLYVSSARFRLYEEDDERPQYQSMMPYFFLVEIWYVRYRMYVQKA